jgi:hypothetical protein
LTALAAPLYGAVAVTEQPRPARAAARLTAAVLALTLVGGAQAGQAPAEVDAAELLAALTEGRVVELVEVDVRGDLRLPRGLDAALILRDSRVHGDVVGAHSSFSRVVDLSGTEIRGRADFAGARFVAPFVFEGGRIAGASSFAAAVFAESARFGRALFGGMADFSGAQFHGEAQFAQSSFAATAGFSLAGFDGGGVFTSARFDGPALFGDARFGGTADFTAAAFRGPAAFANARFAGRAEFIGTRFDGAEGGLPSAAFGRASFEGGATFLQAGFRVNADFVLVTATDDLDFQEASFNLGASELGAGKAVANFSTARLFGVVSFTGATLGGFVNFDQAFVSELDLEDASVGGPIRLPLGRASGGRIGTLRLDLEDAERVDGPDADDRPAREEALALVEASERADEDLEKANDARARRLTLARERKDYLGRTLDYWINTGIWGFGVRPYYQLTWIVFFLLVGTIFRFGWRFGDRARRSDRLRGLFEDLGDSMGALLRLNPPREDAGALRVAEYLVFKVLTVILILNAANVWPVSRQLIEGIF